MTTIAIQPRTEQQPRAEQPVREPPRWPSDAIVLAATYTAPSCTSLFVASMLAAWVEAVALQLVTNAVVMTGSMDEHLSLMHVDDLNTILVGLRQTEAAVVVEVWDSSPEPPIGPAPVGYRSGFYFADCGGKVVWTTVTYPLPKRTPAAFPYPSLYEAANQPNLYMNDLETIQRVRMGLEELPVTAGAGRQRRPA